MSIAKSASIQQPYWECPSEENHSDPRIKLSGGCGAVPAPEAAERCGPPLTTALALLALLASGVPLPADSARLMHGSIRTTQELYSHMTHGQDDADAEALERFQNQPTGVAPQPKGQVQ
jgi:hypothetical protein